ncbi:MAG: insulinase family protein [Opitutaceae bacterium]
MKRFRAHPQLLPVVPILLAICLAGSARGSLDDLPEKAPTDRSEVRHLVLENDLRVILLSDPDLNKSSASMAIGVGSLSDPKDRQGLAHFLEHMLFLGTEKYPGEGDYGNYIRSNGGFANAYTAGELTNYHFEINHDAFEGGLDRFAQFFIAPLFTEEFTKREMNAVDSENEMNLEEDNRRIDQVQRSHFNPNHPENHFATGNSKTLAGLQRQEFIDLFENHYSANRMALALTGSAGLDELEKLARRYFSEIRNRNIDPIVYPADILEPKPVVRLLRIEPIKDKRELVMDFPLPATRRYYESKPNRLVGFILGYEGAGSLLSILKEADLATGLGCGAWELTDDYSFLSITASLTPKGLENWEQVMRTVFAYVENMRRSPYPEFLFRERATMARLDELYEDKGDGNDRSTGLANNALLYPLELADRIDYLYTKPDPDSWFMVLDAIRPDTMMASLVAKGLPTDQTEVHYGTPYSYEELGGPLYAELKDPAIGPEITMVQPNPFVPTKVELLAPRPVKLIDEPGLSLFYSQDAEFQRPQVAAVVRIRQPQRSGTLRTAVLKAYYQAVVTEMINEVTYAASEAGLSQSLTASLDGVTLNISGYNQSADQLMRYVVDRLTRIDLPEKRFDALKDRMIRELANASLLDAFRQARETKRKVLQEVYFTPDEQLPVAEGITLGDVKAFARSLYSEGKIEALIHGNISAAEAIRMTRFIKDTLALRPVENKDLFETRLLVQDAGSAIVSIDRLEVNNSCYWSESLLGPDTPENRATALVINNFLEEPFYTEMRTRQQLGYIVWSFTFPQEDELFGGFVIQSADYPADEIGGRVNAFLQTVPQLFAGLSEEDFASLVAGARAQLEEKDKSIAERASRFFLAAYEQEEDWDRDAEALAALDRLTPESVAATLDRMLLPETSRVRTVLAFARQHEPAESTKATIDDVEMWKRGQHYE